MITTTFKEMEEAGCESLHPYCRKLIKEGADPSESMEIYRGTTKSISVPNIGEAAKWTLRETSKIGFHRAKYKPFDRSALEGGDKDSPSLHPCV